VVNVTSVDITIFISGIPEEPSGTLGTTTSSTTTTQETTGELGSGFLLIEVLILVTAIGYLIRKKKRPKD
jgi:LPXTG-motif cell wall-anchored protein